MEMKPSSKSSASSSSSTKSKKNSKDREKRKSQTTTEVNNQHNSDKGSPTKEASTRKYAGISPESLIIYAEQNTVEHLSDEVCSGFTEDLNYKLRHIIHDALTKARLCDRNYIRSTDIDCTFECLSIDKVYGASNTPNWIAFGEQNLFYLDDSKINLIELAEQESSYSQQADVMHTCKLLPEQKESNKVRKNYFVVMCQQVVGINKKTRQLALKDISQNQYIGPMVEWFYHFGYFLLSKDITYDCLTLCALDLIEALENNRVALTIVSEKQLILLVRLILQRLLRTVTTPELLKPMCRMLAILCDGRPNLTDLVLTKIKQKFPEVIVDFALPILSIVSALGVKAICDILLCNIKYFVHHIQNQRDLELSYELLRSYNILCTQGENTKEICETFYQIFGDSIIPIWKSPLIEYKGAEKIDTNWLNVKAQLYKTRKKFSPTKSPYKFKKLHIEEVFPDDAVEVKKEIFEYEFEYQSEVVEPAEIKPKIIFKFVSFAPAVGRQRFLKMTKYQNVLSSQTQVIIGKRTLLTPVLGSFKRCSTLHSKCYNHYLTYQL